MKHQTDIKLIAIAFVLGVIISGTVASIVLKSKPLSTTAQWCISNPKYANWMKERQEKAFLETEKFLLEK